MRRKFWFFYLFPFFLRAQDYVVGEIMGQLGNQLFIIAATVSLALDHGAEPLFPDLAQKTTENIPLNREKIFSHLNLNLNSSPVRLNYTYYEPYFHYQQIHYYPNMKINGYFQSEKYFINHKEEILQLFAAPSHIQNYLEKNYSHIINHPKTVGIHYRSYIHEDAIGLYHPTCKIDYYTRAIAQFPDDSLFVVFSNKIEWCKENFKNIPRNFIFIENEPHYHDLYLMSYCKDQIIGNSSFSWWSAYLNPNPNKVVIAPKRWFNTQYITDLQDLYPAGWIKLPS